MVKIKNHSNFINGKIDNINNMIKSLINFITNAVKNNKKTDKANTRIIPNKIGVILPISEKSSD